MTLMFGDLAGDFVLFSNALLRAEGGDQAALDGVSDAAAKFRSGSVASALHLSIIGSPFCPW